MSRVAFSILMTKSDFFEEIFAGSLSNNLDYFQISNNVALGLVIHSLLLSFQIIEQSSNPDLVCKGICLCVKMSILSLHCLGALVNL